jgi:hypothetical protein
LRWGIVSLKKNPFVSYSLITDTQMAEISFIELIRNICKEPHKYGGGSVKEMLSYIEDYKLRNVTPISGRVFDRYLCIRNSFPENYVWTYVISECPKNEEDAIRMIEENIMDFLQLKERMSDDELIQYAREQLTQNAREQLIEEGEPEKVFRQFDIALLLADESLIRELIEEHLDAKILWAKPYPREVLFQLCEIAARNRIKSLPISEDGNRVKIIAAGWPFPIEMSFRDGRWKINAEKIIQLRLANKRT